MNLIKQLSEWRRSRTTGRNRFLKDNQKELESQADQILGMLDKKLGELVSSNVMDELKYLPSRVLYPQIKDIYAQKVYLLANSKYSLTNSEKDKIADDLTNAMMIVIREKITESGKWKVQDAVR